MNRYTVDPMPEMVSQRLIPALNFKPLIYAIDPTCGRYCLKALLKHWIEKKTNVKVADRNLLLPRPNKPTDSSWLSLSDWLDLNKWDSHWIGYHPYDNFQHAERLLEKGSKPTTLDGWKNRLESNGPIILAGILGAASVGHYILLVGVDTDENRFIFKDPLTGNDEQDELFESMERRIEVEIVYGNNRIINELPSVHGDMVNLENW